jgi:hypothetical protein
MKKWYGSVNNRVEENRMYCEKIEVGTGMTEYLYSDTHAYEVVEVKDQKHIKVREYDHKLIGEAFSNRWELISNENNSVYELTKRGNYWYWTVTVTSDILKDLESEDRKERVNTQLFLCHNDIDIDKLREKGKITKYHRANVSFGIAQYYYDYSF